MRLWVPAATAAALLALAGRALADDAELFNEYLKYSQEIAAKHHLIVRAEFERESGKAKKIAFRYDRYPEIERMQLPSGASYVRKKGGKWIKSDDWGETGKPAPASATKDFDDWIGLIDAPLHNIGETRDKSQGGVRPTLVENDEDAKPDEIRFILSRENPTGFAYPRFGFVKFQDKALLRFYGGAMRYGEERLTASIGYDFMFLVDMKVVTPSPTPIAAAAATGDERADNAANQLLRSAMLKMALGTWEVDMTLTGKKTTRVKGLMRGKDFDLTREEDGGGTPLRQVAISSLGWSSSDRGKTWQQMKPVDRSVYDWAHTAAMANRQMPEFETVGFEEEDGERLQHVRMKVEENVPDDSRWHYWIALNAKGEALSIRRFAGAGIIRGEVVQTKGTYRPSKVPFIRPPMM